MKNYNEKFAPNTILLPELAEVHHGIAAANSEFVMNWISKHKIQLNVCPSSNVMLSLVEDYSVHPIRRLYDH